MNGAIVIGIMVTRTVRSKVIVARHRQELSVCGRGTGGDGTAWNNGVVTDFPLLKQPRKNERHERFACRPGES